MIPPQILMEDIPLTLKAAQTILNGRVAAENVIKGKDDRLLVVVGPCSIHDVEAAKEYGSVILDIWALATSSHSIPLCNSYPISRIC